jgi:hypothetical protein
MAETLAAILASLNGDATDSAGDSASVTRDSASITSIRSADLVAEILARLKINHTVGSGSGSDPPGIAVPADLVAVRYKDLRRMGVVASRANLHRLINTRGFPRPLKGGAAVQSEAVCYGRKF